MPTTEKREEYSANVVRVLHPTNFNNGKSSSDLDNNLDYLLEDLQSSIKKHGNNTFEKYIGYNEDTQYLSPINSSTIIKERSVSPGSESKKIYKTANYQYSTSTNYPENKNQKNQLDTLLQDLKSEREATLKRETRTPPNIEISTEYLGTDSLHKKSSSTTYRKETKDFKTNAKRELIFDSPESIIHEESSKLQQTSPLTKTIETKILKDVSFEPSLPKTEHTISTKKYDYTMHKERSITPQPQSVLKTTDFSEDLKNVALSDDILPVPGTKVTTTVRTYTYEIPAEPITTTKKTMFYKNEKYDSSSNIYPEQDIPSSNIIYNTENYTSNIKNEHIAPPVTKSSQMMIHTKDIRETNGYSQPILKEPYTGGTNTTIIHNQNIENTNSFPENYIIKPLHSPNDIVPNQHGGPTTTYYYKHESSNTTNTLYGLPDGASQPHPNDDIPKPIKLYPSNRQLTSSPHSPKPNTHPDTGYMTNSYSYSSKTTNMHSEREREPLLQPAPFPTDGIDITDRSVSPPKRLDDLLATFGNEPNNIEKTDTYTRRKEIETAVATGEKPTSTIEPKIPSKNIAGPPVYYPPGHEMFARKEESSAAYKAGGGYGKAAGKYEYEASEKSKSKSKKGATMVPVCLPLCCAMPCSIM